MISIEEVHRYTWDELVKEISYMDQQIEQNYDL
jgi:hypothetical protein